MDSISIECFVKTSDNDQELECEMHQTKYEVTIECEIGPHDDYSYCSLLIWGMVNLERHIYKRDDVVKP
jgi:hypothetical protein